MGRASAIQLLYLTYLENDLKPTLMLLFYLENYLKSIYSRISYRSEGEGI